MTDVFIESMLCEQASYLDKMDAVVNDARLALLDAIDPGPLFEAGSAEPEKSGGIMQAILRLINALIKSIGDGFKKIGNWMTGAKVTPEGKNAKIQGMDPNVVVKLVDGDLADASDALRKAANGQMSIEEAKAFIDKKESVWQTVKSSAIPVVGLAAFFLGKRFTVDKWIAQANAAKDELEKQNRASDPNASDSKLAANLAHKLPGQERNDAAKAASNMIVNYMNQTSKRGFSALMGPLQDAFTKKYLTKNLLKETDMMGTEEGRKELAARDKDKQRQTKAATRAFNKFTRNVNKASNAGNKALDTQNKLDEKFSAKQRNWYDSK